MNFPIQASLTPVFFSNLKSKEGVYTMEWDKRHKQHRAGTFAQWQEVMLKAGQKTRDEYDWYARRNDDFAIPRTWFEPECPHCIRDAENLAKHNEEIRRQDEEYKQRQKEWEEAEKAKPPPAPPAPVSKPPPKPKQTPEEAEEWRLLCEEEKVVRQNLARILARMRQLTECKQEDKLKCKECNVYLTNSQGHYDADKRKKHYASKKHQLRVGLIEVDVYPKHCDKCDYTAKTKHYWEQHCAGKKHKSRTEEQSCVVPTTDDFSSTSNAP